jgi:hypothetical protein
VVLNFDARRTLTVTLSLEADSFTVLLLLIALSGGVKL